MPDKFFDFKKISEKLFSKNGTKVLLIVGFVGIALIFLSEFIPVTVGQTQAAKSGASCSSAGLAAQGAASSVLSSDTDSYEDALQSQLKTLVCSIKGVGKADVMITFSGGPQYVYEQQQKKTAEKSSQKGTDGAAQTNENDDNETQPVIISGESGQQPIVKTELKPTAVGVVVVCDGGDDPTVEENVIDAVTTALDLPANHVCVIKKSQ